MRVVVALALAAALSAPAPAGAGVLCQWFGRCLYESPGFTITAADRETGQPIAGVHALAEWVEYAVGRRNGPLMAQGAVSGDGGALSFPAWGPVRGHRDGLVLNSDPVVSLFKPGYKVLVLNNAYPPDAHETDRVHAFQQSGRTFMLERFRGTTEQWVEELLKAAYPPTIGGAREEQIRMFRAQYLGRRQRVWQELQALSPLPPGVANEVAAFGHDLRRLEELGP